MFKNSELTSDDVQVVSVDFVNQVMNSKCDITNREMLVPVNMRTEFKSITTEYDITEYARGFEFDCSGKCSRILL